MDDLAKLTTALAATEAKFKRFLAAMPDAVLVVNSEGVIELASEQAERLFQYDRNEMLDLPIDRLLPPRLRHAHGEQMRRYFDKPGIRPMGTGLDLWALRKDGTEVPVEISLSPYHGPGKAVVIAAIRDITPRRQAELELRNSRERLERAQRISGTGSFERDLRTGHVTWSAQTYRLFALDEAAPVPSRDEFLELVYADDRDKYGAAMDASEHGLPASPTEFRILSSDGTIRWIYSELDVILDDTGTPMRRVGTYRDITKQKCVEQELMRSRENLARAQRIAHVGCWEHDLVNNATFYSDEFLIIWGLTNTSPLASCLDLAKFVHPEDRQEFIDSSRAAVKGWAVPPFDFRIHRPGGAERILHCEHRMDFDENDRPIRFFATVQDITELHLAQQRERELEKQLMHSQKLEALGTLAGGIAHDLNNTLVPIMALSKITAREFEIDSPLRANLETIFDASQQARDLVKRILAFSRNEEVDKRICDVAEIVNEALKLMRATVPSTIRLEARIAPVPPIMADASQIQQLVTNLIMNAAQAIGHQLGKVTVILDTREDASFDREICLSVLDTGAGIEEGVRQRIFEPFFTTKPVGQGTGLGLSIVHAIVTSHSGRIDVRSARGEGTRFEIYFPVPEATAQIALTLRGSGHERYADRASAEKV